MRAPISANAMLLRRMAQVRGSLKLLQEVQAMYGQCGGKGWTGYTTCQVRLSII